MTEAPNRIGILGAICGIVGAIILLKALGAALGWGRNSTPGIERGDFVLEEQDLQETIGSWKRTGFNPAKSTDQLSRGEYWWTHSWTYKSDSSEATVSFDQANWVDWHDLTACYRMAGWNLKTREIKSEDNWPYVIATFDRPGANAVLVYSMFYDDGAPVPPAAFESAQPDPGLLNDLRIRNGNKNVRFSGRAFQCQVFTVEFNNDPISAIALHLLSRIDLRDATALRENR